MGNPSKSGNYAVVGTHTAASSVGAALAPPILRKPQEKQRANTILPYTVRPAPLKRDLICRAAARNQWRTHPKRPATVP